MPRQSIRERLSPMTRAWLALLVLLAPIGVSFISGVIFQMSPVNHSGGLTLNFQMVGLILLRWVIVLTLAFYLLGFRETFLFWGSFKVWDVPMGLFWSFAIRLAGIILVLPLALLLTILFPVLIKAQEHRMFGFFPTVLIRTEPLIALLLFGAAGVIAGFCEESWRYGMFRVFSQLMPKSYESPWGKLGIIAIISGIFGCAHTYEGITGALGVAILGAGLGWLMIYRKSFWQPALAHFFIDFGSGLMIYLLVAFHLERIIGF